MASDLTSASAFVLDQGDLARAMRATMAIPGLFTPVRVGDAVLVDGSLFNNVPADVVRRMGADVVIAVDVHADEPAAQGEPAESLFTLLGARSMPSSRAVRTRPSDPRTWSSIRT